MSVHPDDPLIGEDIAGYRVVAQLGEGGMGRVYRGVLASIGAQVAIKVLAKELIGDAEMAERFVAEARLANLVRHDGVVNVIGIGVLPDGRPYQIMELLTGEPLAAIIARRRALPLGSLCELVCEALAALAPMHARGIVHRDLKPSNLFVTAGGRLKIIDFGIAKLTTQRGLTRTGQTIGTPDYMAPEQIEGDDVDGRTDLYALGVVLYEGATGTRPFAGRILEALATHPDPPAVRERVPDAPAALDAVIRTAMAPDRAKRFADTAAMERALRELIAALPAGAFGPLIDPTAPSIPAPPPSPTAPTVVDRPPSPSPSPPPSPSASPPPSAEAPTRKHASVDKLDKYEVRGVIGQGGAGIVMSGFDPAINRRVALKVLHDSSGRRRDRLTAEARAMAKVGHPNVVTLYELGDDAGQLFLVMELVEGTDVAGWLRERVRPWREIAEVLVGAGRGLAAAHAVGVIHRDFKPSNVLLGTDGRPRVTDFGLAHTGDDGGTGGGTAAYIAPEQLEGAPADPQSDQFAFCAAMWEALHGELPFAGTSAIAIATAARAGKRRPPARPEVPAAVNAALARGLAPAAGDRFPAMTDLLAALDRAIAPPRPAWRPWIAAGVVGAAAVTAAIVVATRDRSPAKPPAPTITLADVHAAPSPGAVFERLAQLSPRDLASVEARTLAGIAAAAGPIRTIEIGAPITSLAFSEDLQTIAAGAATGVTIVELEGPRVTRTAPLPSPPIAMILPDDRAVLVLVSDGLVELPLDGGPARYRLQCPVDLASDHPFPVRVPIRMSKHARYIACPGDTGSAIYDTAASPAARVMDVDGLATFSSDSKRVAIYDIGGGRVVVRDLATGGEIGVHDAHKSTILIDNGALVAVSADEDVALWDPRTGTERTIETELSLSELILTDGANPLLLAVSTTGRIVLWGRDGTTPFGWDAGDGADVTMAWDRQTRLLIGTGRDLELRDLVASRTLRFGRPVDGVAIAPDGATIAVATGSILSLWFDLRPPRSFSIPDQPHTSIALSADPDQRWLARGVPGRGVVLTDLIGGDEVVVPGSAGAVAVDLTADAAIVAFGTADGRVMSWTRGSAAPPVELGRSDAIARVAVVDALHAIVLETGDHARLAAGGQLTAPCGDHPVLGMRAPLVTIRDGETVATCDVLGGRRTTLMTTTRPIGVWTSADGTHDLIMDPGGEVSLIRKSDGARQTIPTIVDAQTAALDARGDRAIVVSRSRGLVVVERGAAAPIVLAGGSELAQARISPDGTRVAALQGGTVVAWDVAHPDQPRILGTLAMPSVTVLSVPNRRVVVTIHGGVLPPGPDGVIERGHVLDEWPDGPASPDDVAGWIRRVAPR